MEEAHGYIDIRRDDGSITPLKVECHTIIEQARLAENIRENLKRPLARFVNRAGFGQIKTEPLAIVATGPSLRETINDLRDFANILVCGSAHDYVVRAGITPTYALVSDGGKDDKGNLSLPQKDTTYIIASQCDPGLLDHLEGYQVELWHYKGQAVSDPLEEARLLNYEPAIAWGSTVTINAVTIALMIGHQHLHFFGFDSCYGDFGLAQHACAISGSLAYQKIPAKIGNREFISDLGLLAQSEQFFRLIEAQGEFFHSTIHGDGLIAECIRQGEKGLEQYVSLAQ